MLVGAKQSPVRKGCDFHETYAHTSCDSQEKERNAPTEAVRSQRIAGDSLDDAERSVLLAPAMRPVVDAPLEDADDPSSVRPSLFVAPDKHTTRTATISGTSIGRAVIVVDLIKENVDVKIHLRFMYF